jgi:hypothetical protein
LDNNAYDEGELTAGIHFFRCMTLAVRATIEYESESLHSVVIAGVRVQLHEFLRICENDVELRSGRNLVSPFLGSFQRRIATLRGLKKAILKERIASRKKNDCLAVGQQALSSKEFPSLIALCALRDTGLSYLNMYPRIVCEMSKVASAESESIIAMMTAKVIDICLDFQKAETLSIFGAWSPRRRKVQKPIKLDPALSHANAGNAAHAIDGSPHTFWTGPKRERSYWSISLANPTDTSAISVNWKPSNTSGNDSQCGAPRKLSIVCKTSSGALLEIGDFDMSRESAVQVSWSHIYPCEAKNVVEISLIMNGHGRVNRSEEVKIYKLSVNEFDREAQSVCGLQLLQSTLNSLLKLVSTVHLRREVLSAALSMCRSSGSLVIIVQLLTFLIERGLDRDCFEETSMALMGLLEGVNSQIVKLKAGILSSCWCADVKMTGVKFDATQKSQDAEILENGAVVSFSRSNSYAMLSCSMDTGVWEWEFSIFSDVSGDETICFGVSKKNSSSCHYESTKDMWLVRCYNGESYHRGRLLRKALPKIHPGDVCKFVYDTHDLTLALTINDLDIGVIFDNVSLGVSPVVTSYGSRKAVRLMSMIRKGEPNYTLEGISFPSTDTPDWNKLKTRASLSSVVLERVGDLSKLVANSVEKGYRVPPTSLLELPFAVQASGETLSALLRLLELLVPQHDCTLSDTCSLIGIINILDAQFSCIIKSNVNPADLGISGKISDSYLLQIASILHSCMLNGNNAVNLCATRVFARSVSLFLPHLPDRIELALYYLKEILPSYDASSAIGAEQLILGTLLSHLSNTSDVLELIGLYVYEWPWRNHISQLVRYIVLVSTQEYFKQPLQSQAYSPALIEGDKDFQCILVQVLRNLVEQVVYEIASSDSPDDAIMEILIDLLACFTQNILPACLNIIKSWANTVSNPLADIKLRSSIVSLVHPVIASLALCSNNLLLCERLSPQILDFLKDIAPLCRLNLQCQLALRSINEELDESSLNMRDMGSTRAGWRAVPSIALVEGESAFSITDSGALYTSVQSTNTCAISNIGFSGDVKAAWEFVLEGDSSNDECSVFGAARVPVSNRCYSSSPDLWMLRAYNGYLYAGGRLISSSMPKVHPGNRVRIEYDGAAGTISFRYRVLHFTPEFSFHSFLFIHIICMCVYVCIAW